MGCCCLSTPIASGGRRVRYSRLSSTSQLLCPSDQQCCHSSGVCPTMRMWVQLKRLCLLCVCVLQIGKSGDGCDMASTLCKYDLRKGDFFYGVGCGTTIGFTVTHIWWCCVWEMGYGRWDI